MSIKTIQVIMTLVLVVGIIGGLVYAGVWLDRTYLRPEVVQATRTTEPNPLGPWNTATVYPTVSVEDLPFGMEESPIEAARTALPTEVPLSTIFAFSKDRANEYWQGFQPGYQFSFINTAGSQRVRQGTADEVLEWHFFKWGGEWPRSRLEVGATVDVGVIVGFAREAIVNSIVDISVNNETIDVLVELPSECAVVVAVPIVEGNSEIKPDIDLDRIQVPSVWYNTETTFDETEMNQLAIAEGTYLAVKALLEEDILHQVHRASVLGEELPATYQVAGQGPARPNIESIVKEAVCWKMAQFGRSCDPTKIEITLIPGPAPDRLLRCGSGHPILDVPYASKHVDLNATPTPAATGTPQP